MLFSPHVKRFFPCLAIFFVLASFIGCAKNDVRLVYSPAAPESSTTPMAQSICVVTLEDARGGAAIGQRSDGSAFNPDSSVTDWLSHAIGAELSRQGFVVTYSSSLATALHGSAAYVLTGAVERVWLTERSVGTAFDCSIRVRLALQVGQKLLLKNTFTSSVSRRVVPLSSVPQEMLTEAAGELSQAAALGIRQKVLP